MTRISRSADFERELCNIFEVQAERTYGITIIAEPNSVLRVVIDQVVDDDQTRQLIPLLRDYDNVQVERKDDGQLTLFPRLDAIL
jgi:hypothetical protein